jgi:oligopeptide transport system ATP-binding protein
MTEPIVAVSGLKKYFRRPRIGLLQRGAMLRAVDGVDLEIHAGETFGIVGESGCGKSTTGRLILRLIEPTEGTIAFEGKNILSCSGRDLQALRRQMQIVFQDPLSSLSPRMRVGLSVADALRFHGLGDRRERLQRAAEYLDHVGLGPEYFHRLPHELSGGQNQRVAIARALILQPKLLVLDEPVSALDVSIRAQILRLLIRLQQELGLTYVFISHDLSVVRRICDRTAVFYLGRVVEQAESRQLYRSPLHPYTQALLDSIPTVRKGARRVRELGGVEGDVPDPTDPPKGCRFHPRCRHRMPICTQEEPTLREVSPGQKVACFLHDRSGNS